MIDRTSPAFIAACEAFNSAPQCPELGAEIALAEAIAAYEKARPKLPTITGLPETLPDGTRIVGWRWGVPVAGEWYWITSQKRLDKITTSWPQIIAITETQP